MGPYSSDGKLGTWKAGPLARGSSARKWLSQDYSTNNNNNNNNTIHIVLYGIILCILIIVATTGTHQPGGR